MSLFSSKWGDFSDFRKKSKKYAQNRENLKIMAMVKLGHHGLRKLPGVSEGAQISIYKLRNRYGGVWEKNIFFDFLRFFLAYLTQIAGVLHKKLKIFWTKQNKKNLVETFHELVVF